MQAVILAGGRGTRLGERTRVIPKPMILIGGKPLLQYQVELLVKYGIRDIIILVNYLKEPIRDFFRDGSHFGAQIRYFEEPEPLGTTGGIREIEAWLIGDFMILYGDVMVNMDLARLADFHVKMNSQCTLVLHPNDHPYDSDLVETGPDGRISAFHPKPHTPDAWYSNLVNAGIYLLSLQVLPFIEKGKKADFGRHLFPSLSDKIRMFGYRTAEYLKDMGTPDRLEAVQTDLESGRIASANYENPRKAIFMDRDGVINHEKNFISKPEDFELFDFASSAIRKINRSGYLSIIVTNQSAVARNLCTEEDVRTIHRKMETELGRDHAWIDAVYYCPHHPDRGFPEENPKYKIDCECRKPKTGMFMQAIRQFHIHAGESYMIGDSERDVQAGINAGCMTIGVRTGYGIKKTSVMPDYMFSNLSEAVDFIVDDPYRPVFERIRDDFGKWKEGLPRIILVGGNARTGKSTLSAYLRLRFAGEGLHVVHVSLDSWLVPATERTHDMGVYQRFRLEEIENDLLGLFSGNVMTRHSYANHPERASLPVTYDPSKADVLIIDGVVALSSSRIREKAHLRLFTTLDPTIYRKRFREYYAWRGKSPSEIELLFAKRQEDEYQLIEKESTFADLVINPYQT